MPKQHSLGTHTRRPSHATPKREGRRTKLDGGKPSANYRFSEASLYAVNTLRRVQMSASEDVARIFANADKAITALIVGASGVDPEAAKRLGY